jgi:hypothetical protein
VPPEAKLTRALIAFALALASAAPAAAQTFNERRGPLSFRDRIAPPDEPLWDNHGEMSLWTSVFVGHPDDGTLLSVSPVVRGHYDFVDDWGAHFTMPLSYVDASTPAEPGGAVLRFANVSLGGHRRFSHEATSGVVGFDVAIPTAWVPDDVEPVEQDTMRLAFATSAATMGGMKLWSWAPERLSFVLSGGVSHRFVESLDTFVEAAVAPMIPVGDEGTDTDLFVDARVGAAWVLPDLLRLGIAFDLAWLPTSGLFGMAPPDPVQTALEIFGRVWLDTLFLGLAFTMNLDAPAGFAFEDGGIWGLHVDVGARFGETPQASGGAP